MTQILPFLVAGLGAAALLAALYALFVSLRAALTPDTAALEHVAVVSPTRAALLAEKEALLTGLRDLAADHEAGKTSDEDLATAEARMRARAKAVLRALDAEIAPHRAAAAALLALPAELAPGEAEAPDVDDARPEPEPVPRTCFACGATNDDDAAFCKKCGKPLAEVRA